MTSKRLCARLSDDDFLSFDGPTGVTVEPDGPRRDFLHHVGLREHNYRHMMLYRKMKQEAKAGMNRLFETRKSLQAELVDDETVQPPFSLTQITDFAFQREVQTIYQMASKQTRGFYEINRQPDGLNWVIHWMLWRVIRSAQTQELSSASSGAETDCSMLSTCSTAMEYSIPSVRTEQPSPRWWLNSSLSPHTFSDSEDVVERDVKPKLEPGTESHKLNPRKRSYWDHVMDT
ncbi:hypothetical protein PRZ48_005913 [Zasmidium cellare]|uniref:Uncharacterized protein n=1 Tax=Zasmidium cellare TaxID=395010 RepID=A0ABR0EMP6_ZASCE|nr:hypothetical protein PRZ48_005913 [Zasmidium cellare]